MTKNKVIGLRGAIPACGEPIEDVVNEIKNLLKEAKKGAISGIAVSYVGPANSTHTFWAGLADHQSMITAVSILWFRMMQVEVDLGTALVVDDTPPAS